MTDKKTRNRKITIALWSAIALYAISYCGLSLLGDYSKFLSRSGKLRYESGLSAADIREWQPYGIVKYSDRCNFLGVFYSPLVDIDRNFWHKPMNAFPKD